MFFPYQLIVMPWVLTFLCADFACAQLANVVQKSVYNIILSMIYHFFIFRRFWSFLARDYLLCERAYTLKIYIVSYFRGPQGLFLPSSRIFAIFLVFALEKHHFVESQLGTPYLNRISRQKCLSRVFLKIVFPNFFDHDMLFKFFYVYIFLSIFFFVDNIFYVLCFFWKHVLLKTCCSYFFTRKPCTI